MVGHAPDALLLRGFHHGTGAGVEGQHIGLLPNQVDRGIMLTRRIEPGVEPDHANLSLRVDRTHAQREGVDALQHLGNREASHIAGNMGVGDAACCDAGKVAAFVVARVGHGHVGRGLVAGDRFKLHVGKLARHLERGLHVAKAGREDQLVALLRQIADHALGVRAFGDVLDIAGLHTLAQCRLHGKPAFFVLAYPAGGGQWRNVDKPNLQRRRVGSGLGKSGK